MPEGQEWWLWAGLSPFVNWCFHLSVNIILKRMNYDFLSTVFLLYILCSAISILFAFLSCTIFIYQHWIEIVLMYRSYLVHNETTGGKNRGVILLFSHLLLSFSMWINPVWINQFNSLNNPVLFELIQVLLKLARCSVDSELK